MRDVILLLYLHDEKYGKRLLRYLAGKKNPLLYPELVTMRERIGIRTAAETENLVVLTDDAGIMEDSRRKVIYLSREREGSRGTIYRYQKASGIYHDLMELLEMKPTEGAQETDKIREGIFFLLDSEGGGAAPLAVLLSQYLGQLGKCLYLSLTGFPLYYDSVLQEKPDFHTKGLTELLFCVGREELAGQIKGFIKPFGRAEMAAPFVHFKDLLDCSAKEWTGLMQKLRSECGYDSIVIEAGQFFEDMLDIMQASDYPCLVQEPGLCGRIRTAVFMQYCRIEKKDELIRKCRKILPPFERKEGTEILNRMDAEQMAEDEALMNRIGKWLEEMERGEEDDCIIEYDG